MQPGCQLSAGDTDPAGGGGLLQAHDSVTSSSLCTQMEVHACALRRDNDICPSSTVPPQRTRDCLRAVHKRGPESLSLHLLPHQGATFPPTPPMGTRSRSLVVHLGLYGCNQAIHPKRSRWQARLQRHLGRGFQRRGWPIPRVKVCYANRRGDGHRGSLWL